MRDLTMQELAAVAGGAVGNSNAFSRAANSISVRQTNVARSGDASATSYGTGASTFLSRGVRSIIVYWVVSVSTTAMAQ